MNASKLSRRTLVVSRYSPVMMLILIGFLLVGLRVNQSSVGMYDEAAAGTKSWGVDRPIRSDEWLVRLPWLLSQDMRQFSQNLVTAGDHDASVTYDMPVRGPEVFLRPHLLGYLFLSFDMALSAEWWFLVLGTAIAVYLILLKLTIRPTIAFPLAIVVASSPGLHWWTVNSSFDIIIYSMGGTAALLSAIDRPSSRMRFTLCALSGWLYSCAAVVLYPPFQIPTMIASAIIVITTVVDPTKREFIRRSCVSLLFVGTTFLILTLWFVVRHRAGLNAMSNTVYPGARRSSSGGVNLASLFGTPFDSYASRIVAGSVNGTNQSENSSTFLLGLPVLLLIPFGFSKNSLRLAHRLTTFLGTWFLLLMMWMLLPLPGVIGRILLLDRVPPDRVKPSIATLSALVVALFLEHFAKNTDRLHRAKAVTVFAFVTVWAGSTYVVNDIHLQGSTVWLLGLLWVIPVFVAFLRSAPVGLGLLAIISIATSAQINPLHRSVAAITDNRLSREIRNFEGPDGRHWISFSGTAQVRGIMVASGVHVDSSVSPYPDLAFWSRFDPTSVYKSAWNRYGHVHFVLSSGRTRILSPQPDVIEIQVDPCAIGSPILPGTFFVEADPASIPCAQTMGQAEYQGTNWYILQKGG